MTPDQIVDALVTVVTALLGYGALRREIRALRAEIVTLKTEQKADRARLKALEDAA